MLSNVPKFYNHSKLDKPAPELNPVITTPPTNPYLRSLYECGEALI